MVFGRRTSDFLCVFAEIDLTAIAHNVSELHRITSRDARLMAVVKANGYGHGAPEVSRTALDSGAEWLGVARIEEGISLRQAGFTVPILIFGYTSPTLAKEVIDFDLTQTIYTYDMGEAFSAQAASWGKKIRAHVKVDTGMGRLGVLAKGRSSLAEHKTAFDDAVRQVESVVGLKGLEIEGIYTHFASADSAEKSSARRQLEDFLGLLDALRMSGTEFSVRHAANSAALIDMPETHLDMVRPGISIYGLYPSQEVNRGRVSLKPAMTLKSRVIHLKKVPPGFKVSYGSTYQTTETTTIATVAIGYADGLDRLLSSQGHMLVRGRRAPIIGRICMDMTMLDVGGIPDVRIEDEVVVLGTQDGASISADEIASSLNTINYEVVSTLTQRVPRVWLPRKVW
jgi:alanine racemase